MLEKGFFNGMFDLNGDGKMDDLERAMDFAAFVELVESENDDSEEPEDL